MPVQLPSGQVATSLFENLDFVPQDVYKLVTQSDNQYGLQKSVLNLLMEKIAGSNGTTGQAVNTMEVSTGNRVWRQAVIGNQYPTCVSASQPTLSNGNKTATFNLSDPTFAMLSVGQLVIDSETETMARISSMSEGKLTLDFSTNPLNTTFDANDFKQGHQVIATIYQGGIRNYKAQGGGMTLPDYRIHTVGNYSVDAKIMKEDAAQATYFLFDNKYYYIAKAEMIQFWGAEIADNIYYLRDSAAVTGEYPRGASFLYQIRENGGIMKSFTGAQTLTQVEDIEEELISRGAIGEDSIINVVGGVRYGRQFSNMFTPYYETAGKNSVIETEGLHVSKFKTRMNNIIHFYHDSSFNNVNQSGTGRGNSAMWIPNTPSMSEDGKPISPIANIYYGQQGLQTTVINGKIGRDGKTVAVGSNDQPYCQVTATMDRSKVIMNPEKFVWCAGS